jgi:hypothetical protein
MPFARPLSNLQQELLKIYGSNISEADLLHIKDYLARYFARKANSEADRPERDLKQNEVREAMGRYQTNSSTVFTQIVDSLRNKSESELKMLYLRMFQKELKDEWATLTKDADFSSTSEKDIVKAIQKNRYRG